MTGQELFNLIVTEFVPKMEKHDGLSVFARERAKFEGWFKVELLDTLYSHFADVTPEKGRVDICFEDWAIELKTVNTNIRYSGVKIKTRPITKNTAGVVADVDKLRMIQVDNRAVVFVVFPIQAENEDWAVQQSRIEERLQKLFVHQFSFANDIPGILCLGVV